jgi:hypothetical protein
MAASAVCAAAKKAVKRAKRKGTPGFLYDRKEREEEEKGDRVAWSRAGGP